MITFLFGCLTTTFLEHDENTKQKNDIKVTNNVLISCDI